eukprot:m.8847 g.8847  ORF g.8847 m.8847 type:complete len:121 (+) comp6768_c0_seq2:1065-1427(+)
MNKSFIRPIVVGNLTLLKHSGEHVLLAASNLAVKVQQTTGNVFAYIQQGVHLDDRNRAGVGVHRWAFVVRVDAGTLANMRYAYPPAAMVSFVHNKETGSHPATPAGSLAVVLCRRLARPL